MTEQGYPPRRPGGRPDQYGRPGWSRIPQEPRRSGWQQLDAFNPGAEPEDEPPPWAGAQPLRPVRRPRPASVDVVDVPPEPPPASRQAQEPGPEPRRGGQPGRSRAAATRRRRSKRRLVTLAGVVVVIALVVAAVYYLRQPAAKTGGPITTLQKGEYAKVPDACRAVPASVLAEYLGPAPTRLPTPGECTFTIDSKIRFRELIVQVQALAPNAGYGNGSATANATCSFAQQRKQLKKPPKGTPAPPAKITPIGGIGTEAFVAVQVFHVGAGAITDKVVLWTRYRNVLISTSLQGDARGTASAREYELRTGALAVTSALLRAVKAEPVISSGAGPGRPPLRC